NAVIDPTVSSPVLLSVNVNHSTLNLDRDTGSVIAAGDNTYLISLAVEGVALLADQGSSPNIILKGFKPGSAEAFFERLIRTVQVNGDTVSFESHVSFTIRRSDIGLLRLEFSLQMGSTASGNTIQLPLLITRTNSAPQL